MWWMRSHGSAATLTQVLSGSKLRCFGHRLGHTKHLALGLMIPLPHGFAVGFSVAVK